MDRNSKIEFDIEHWKCATKLLPNEQKNYWNWCLYGTKFEEALKDRGAIWGFVTRTELVTYDNPKPSPCQLRELLKISEEHDLLFRKCVSN